MWRGLGGSFSSTVNAIRVSFGAAEVGHFLEHLAQSEKDPLRCLEQAHESLTFL
jgi:hypothetical protein